MRTRIVLALVSVVGLAATACGTDASPDTGPADRATLAPDNTTPPTTDEPLPPTTETSATDTAVATTNTVVTISDDSTPVTSGLPEEGMAGSGEAQKSPEAVVEAYYEAADANDAGAMFLLISPQRREGIASPDWADCLSDVLTDISGADVTFEHTSTYVEVDSTFVEAVITLSEQGEGAVPSDDEEILAVPGGDRGGGDRRLVVGRELDNRSSGLLRLSVTSPTSSTSLTSTGPASTQYPAESRGVPAR